MINVCINDFGKKKQGNEVKIFSRKWNGLATDGKLWKTDRLTNTHLYKLKCAAKNNTETTLRITKNNF